MIDLHCHILPGVDDGPDELEDSIEMARVAQQDGIAAIVATPHSVDWAQAVIDETVVDQASALSAELARRNVDLQVLPGLEVYLTPESAGLYSEGKLPSLNGSRYILVEFSFHTLPPYTEQALFDLQLRQLVPVIAHPERNAAIAANPDILARMVDRGMLAQVTSGSLTGYFGSRVRETAELLLTRGLVHVIASDGHSAGYRPPALAAATRRAGEIIGDEAARQMVTDIPRAILDNREVDTSGLRRAQPRSRLPFARRR